MDVGYTKRTRRKARTRRAVLDAARVVFHERGYEGATIALIARAAGVSAGTVLNVSPTKVALLIEVVREDFDQLGEDGEALAASLNAGPADMIGAILTLHLERHCKQIDLVSALIGHCWLSAAGEFDLFFQTLDLAWAPVRTVLSRAAADGLLRSPAIAPVLVDLLQDSYLGALRRCTAGDADLAAATLSLRRRLSVLLDPHIVQPAAPKV